jgi:hypothetical protein
MYDPTPGIFLSRDPIGPADDVNEYRYVKNNPTNATDPTGLFAEDNEKSTTVVPSTKSNGFAVGYEGADLGGKPNPSANSAVGKILGDVAKGGNHDVYVNSSDWKSGTASPAPKLVARKAGVDGTVRIAMVGFSQGANTALTHAKGYADEIRKAGAKPEILLILIDRYRIGDQPPPVLKNNPNEPGLLDINTYASAIKIIYIRQINAGVQGAPAGDRQTTFQLNPNIDKKWKDYLDATKDSGHGAIDDFLLTKDGRTMTDTFLNPDQRKREYIFGKTPTNQFNDLSGGLPVAIETFLETGQIYPKK